MKEELKFKECKICSEEPGSPVLCESCLENRKTIEYANNIIRNLKRDIKKYRRAQNLKKYYCCICNCELNLGTSRRGKTLGHCPNCKRWQGIR